MEIDGGRLVKALAERLRVWRLVRERTQSGRVAKRFRARLRRVRLGARLERLSGSDERGLKSRWRVVSDVSVGTTGGKAVRRKVCRSR